MRPAWAIFIAMAAFGCGKSGSVPRVRITRFSAPEKTIPRGLTGKLCYTVENAAKLEMQPKVDDVWPGPPRCVEVTPLQKTTYTLTAFGEDGSRDTKSVEVNVGAPPPRVFNLRARPVEIRRGAGVQVCFEVENATKVKVSPGRYRDGERCLSDRPKKTTTYRITALGGDRQEDVGTVTVKVR